MQDEEGRAGLHFDRHPLPGFVHLYDAVGLRDPDTFVLFPNIGSGEVYQQAKPSSGQMAEKGQHGLVEETAPDASGEDIA